MICRSLLSVCFLLCLPVAVHTQASPAAAPEPKLRSHIKVYRMSDHSTREVFTAEGVWEAPNWSPDGKYLLVSHSGGLEKLIFQGDGSVRVEHVAVSEEYRCNNDKAVSPDGKWIGFSATKAPAKGSNVYLAKADGSGIQAMTTETPSYFHGWSPDGKTMAFVAYRNGQKQFDVWSVPTSGSGPEKQLNADSHHDDGPDYSPDGKWLYINSDRGGHEAIWRFPADGAGDADSKAEKVVDDGKEDWFPHISPDGNRLVYIAYPAGTATHNPRTLHVEMKLVNLAEGKPGASSTMLVSDTGGQGTLNVNSWSPDSSSFAFIGYEIVP
jgi:TolB protein